MTYKTITFYLTKNHPDFEIAKAQSSEVRRLRNALNALLRADFFYHQKGDDADLSIPDEMGFGDIIRARQLRKSKNGICKMLPAVKQVQQIDLHSKIAQSTARGLADSWSSFYALRKKGLFARIPGYGRKYGTAEYNPQALSTRSLRLGWIKPAQWTLGFQIPARYARSVTSAKLVPIHDGLFALKVLYHDSGTSNREYVPTPGLWAGIDPGVNNLMTIGYSDLAREGLIVDGRPLKNINSHYNAVCGQLRSHQDESAKTSYGKPVRM